MRSGVRIGCERCESLGGIGHLVVVSGFELRIQLLAFVESVLSCSTTCDWCEALSLLFQFDTHNQIECFEVSRLSRTPTVARLPHPGLNKCSGFSRCAMSCVGTFSFKIKEPCYVQVIPYRGSPSLSVVWLVHSCQGCPVSSVFETPSEHLLNCFRDVPLFVLTFTLIFTCIARDSGPRKFVRERGRCSG